MYSTFLNTIHSFLSSLAWIELNELNTSDAVPEITATCEVANINNA